MKLEEALKEYLVHIQVNEGRSPRTVSSYDEDLKQYTAFCQNTMSQIQQRSRTS